MKIRKIGPDCFFNAVSCNLEYSNKLWLSLYYTYGIFIYNKGLFTKFIMNKQPKDYLVPENMLYFRTKPLSLYRQYYDKFIENNISNTFLNKYLKSIELNQIEDLKYIKDKFLNNNISLILPVNVSMLKSEYQKSASRFPQGDMTYHFVNLFDIDIKNSDAFIIDAYFQFKGNIPKDLLINSVKDSINGFKNSKIYYIELDNELDNDITRAINYSLDLYKREEIIIDGIIFESSLEATESLYYDIYDILELFNSLFKEYTSQFMSFQLIPIRRQKDSICEIILELKKYNFIMISDDLINLLVTNSKLWNRLDYILDLIFLRNQNIIKEKHRIRQCLNDILDNEILINKEIKLLYMP